MTEPLSVLMREEVDRITVPVAPTDRILALGHRARRRRTAGRAATALCLVLVCVAGYAGLTRTPGSERLDGDLRIADTARAAAAYASEGAYAVGRDIVIGENRFEWPEPIKALHYTSAGVVIQSGENPDRDEGVSAFALVTPTGEWSSIDVELHDQVAGFETDSSRFAYAEPRAAGLFDLVVHDAATDEEVARTTVEIPARTIGWLAPPAAIHGDEVWVRGDDGWIRWTWRTGGTTVVPGTTSTYEIAGGRYADWQDRQRWIIRSMADQAAEVRELDLRDGWYGFFSPDGRYLRAFPNEKGEESPVDYEFFSVESGAAWQLRDVVDTHERVDLGWSPDGHVLLLLDDTLSVCDPDTGACRDRADDVGSGTIRLGGEPYGS